MSQSSSIPRLVMLSPDQLQCLIEIVENCTLQGKAAPLVTSILSVLANAGQGVSHTVEPDDGAVADV